MGILRCKEAFAVTDSDGAALVFAPGDLVDEKNKHVKGRESLFETVEANVERTPRDVESATAAPGEKRSRTRPAAKKSAAKADDKADDSKDD